MLPVKKYEDKAVIIFNFFARCQHNFIFTNNSHPDSSPQLPTQLSIALKDKRMLIVTSALAAWITFTTKVLNVVLHILSLLNPSHLDNPGNENVYHRFHENSYYFDKQARFRLPHPGFFNEAWLSFSLDTVVCDANSSFCMLCEWDALKPQHPISPCILIVACWVLSSPMQGHSQHKEHKFCVSSHFDLLLFVYCCQRILLN